MAQSVRSLKYVSWYWSIEVLHVNDDSAPVTYNNKILHNMVSYVMQMNVSKVNIESYV